MSKVGNEKKNAQLGMPFGTASGRLRKLVLFSVLERHEENVCFQCGNKINSADDLSIEHKVPWLDTDARLFWDINNIAFSHLSCNISAARQTKAIKAEHGIEQRYKDGCRCELCVTVHNTRVREYQRRKRKSVDTGQTRSKFVGRWRD